MVRKHQLKTDFFQEITPQSLYWAGFIAADGCIENNRVLSINLANKDISHLKLFQKHIKTQKPIEYRKNNSSRMRIFSVQIVEDLKKFNIIPRKTHKLTFPNIVKNHSLVNIFVRGYFDGDGSAVVRKRKNGWSDQLYIEFPGTESFLTSLQDIFLKYNLISNKSNKTHKRLMKNKNTFVLRYGGNVISKQILN